MKKNPARKKKKGGLGGAALFVLGGLIAVIAFATLNPGEPS